MELFGTLHSNFFIPALRVAEATAAGQWALAFTDIAR